MAIGGSFKSNLHGRTLAFSNPTDGHRWIVQVQPFIPASRLDLNDPPTAVKGIELDQGIDENRPPQIAARSQRPAQMPVEVAFVAMAQLQFRAVAQDDLVIAARPGVQLTNEVEVDDG